MKQQCGDWRLEREIGQGAYGVVYLAIGSGGERVAVKVCRSDAVGDERYARELRGSKLYRTIPHQEGLVRMRELVETEWGFYIVMDLADDEFASDGAASPGRAASPFAAASGEYRPKTLASVIDGEKALPLGECVKLGNTTYHYNANGTSAGRTTSMGNTTYHYNANGTSAGRSTTMGNTTYHYNANGTSAGRSTTMGNTTYYYGPNGAPAGSATRTGW